MSTGRQRERWRRRSSVKCLRSEVRLSSGLQREFRSCRRFRYHRFCKVLRKKLNGLKEQFDCLSKWSDERDGLTDGESALKFNLSEEDANPRIRVQLQEVIRVQGRRTPYKRAIS